LFIKTPQKKFFFVFSPWTDRSISTSNVPPSHLNYTDSSPNTEISSSRLSSYYTSLQSSRISDDRNKHGSPTTIYGSSHQSDSLFNEPTIRKPARILTTSYDNNQKDNPRLKFYRDLSTPTNKTSDKYQNLSDIDRGNVISSNINLSSGKNFY